jgi:fimbrial chaperone protein
MRKLQTALIGLVLVATPALPVQAGSFDVAPSTIDLSAKGGTAVLYVVNRGAKPITAQVEGFDWSQSDGKDQLTASHTLLISPPMAKLMPGERQVVRLQVPARAEGQPEGSYRLVVSELPTPEPMAQKGVRMLVQFSVPVFAGVKAESSAESKLDWEAHLNDGNLTVTVHNKGNIRAKLVGLHITTPQDRKQGLTRDLFYYILAGSSRQWTVKTTDVKVGDRVDIMGRNATDDSVIHTSVSIAP